MADPVVGAIGAAIVLTVALDVFRSLLLPRANTRVLRVGPLLSIALFKVWHAFAGRVTNEGTRQGIRASFAPLTLVLTFAAWTALLVAGFAMLLWSERSAFHPALSSFADALYVAGSAFSTLGADATVTSNAARATLGVASIAGLTIVTVVATFLIAIQASFSRREALVLRLESHVTLPPAGIAILETYAREGIVGRLGPFFDAWEAWASEVGISHRAFPILVFFRSNDSRCEWLAALGAILDAAALLDATLDDMPAEAKAGAHFVLRTGSRVLRDMAGQIAEDVESPTALVDRDRFAGHRERLRDAGFRVVVDVEAASTRFVAHRKTYAAALAALGRRLLIDVDERTSADEDSRPAG